MSRTLGLALVGAIAVFALAGMAGLLVPAASSTIAPASAQNTAGVASLVAPPGCIVSVSLVVTGPEVIGQPMDLHTIVQAAGLSSACHAPVFHYDYQNLPYGCLALNQATLQCIPHAPGVFHVVVVAQGLFGQAIAQTTVDVGM